MKGNQVLIRTNKVLLIPLRFTIAIYILLLSFFASADQTSLAMIVEQSETNGQPLQGYSFHVIESKESFSLTKGEVSPGGKKLSSDNLFRIASVTKTFTAATVLRLMEEDKLSLDAPLVTLIDVKFNSLLKADGYATDKITVRHLLNHTAGLFDHAQSQLFFDKIMAEPGYQWSREEQINALITWGNPLGEPGEKFVYSDSGYILLGHIIENLTGQSLPIAVRELLNLDKIMKGNVMWERGDTLNGPEALRVHQYLQETDTFDWDPSIDLYGGGGLLASPEGMARFYQLLLTDKVFCKAETLQIMLSREGHPKDSPYRLGIFEKQYDNLNVYEHSGFWGTSVMFDIDSGRVIAGAVVRQEDYKALVGIMTNYLKARKQ